MREQKAAKRAMYAAIQRLAESSSNFEGDTGALIIKQAAVAYALLDDRALPLPVGDPAYWREPPLTSSF